jgi:serine protease Do
MTKKRILLKSIGGLAVVAALAPVPGLGQTAEGTATSAAGTEILVPSPEKGQSFLGVNIWEVKPEIAREMDLSEERGALITGVIEGSAADQAGLKKGDVVLEFNGQRVEGVKQFIRLVRETPAGRSFQMKVVRDGSETEVAGSMGRKPGVFAIGPGQTRVIRVPEVNLPGIVIPDVPHVYTTWRSARLGIVGESLEEQLAEYFGVEEGVLVRSVGEDTPASRAGLKAGDVITKVGDARVATPREVSNAIQAGEGSEIRLSVVRERKTIPVDVTVSSGAGGADSRIQRLVSEIGGM